MPPRYSQLRWWKIFSGLHGFHPHNSLVWRHQGAFWWEVFLEVISNHVQNLWNNYNRTFPSFQYDAGKGASSKITHCRIKNLDNDGLSRIINLVARGEMTHCQILHLHNPPSAQKPENVKPSLYDEKFCIFFCSYWLLSSYVLTRSCYCYCYCCANILVAIPALGKGKGFWESVNPRLFVMKIITMWHCARHVWLVCHHQNHHITSPSKSSSPSHHHHHVCLGGCSVTSCVTWHAGVSASPRHYYVTPTSPIFRPNPARCDSCFWTDGEC